jgi:cytochrome c556
MKKPLLVLSLVSALASSDSKAADQPSFIEVMRGLNQHMQIITGAIALADWAVVSKSAALISAQPDISAKEKIRLVTFLGERAAIFHAMDAATHTAAQTLSDAALMDDGAAAISAFANLQSSCLACHQHFRAEFRQQFNRP